MAMSSNPFTLLRERQKAEAARKAAALTSKENSVKQEDITTTDQKMSVIPVDITIGDETVQNLLLQQDNPLELQEKLKALFSVDVKTDDPYPINARELKEFIGLTGDYTHWIDRMISYGFIEGKDFKVLLVEKSEQTGRGGSNKKEHKFTLDMAKEIAMIQRNNLGRLVRTYLIWAEKKLHQITAVISQQQVQVPKNPGDMLIAMGNALNSLKVEQDIKISGLRQDLEVTQQQVKDLISTDMKLQQQIEENNAAIKALRDRQNRADSISSVLTEANDYDPISAEGNITVSEMADILKERYGFNTGRDRLYDWLADNGMVIRYKKKGFKAAKRFSDLGWFETEEESVNTPFSSVPVTRYKVWITQKGKQGIAARFSLAQ